MSQHVLSLEAPETLNLCILRLVDTSIYSQVAPPTCPRLTVQVPGFSRGVDIPNAQPGFIYNLTACDLGIQTQQCGTQYYDLPDGIYVLRYSVSPNDIVYVEYNHLRITKALRMIYDILCDLDRGACTPSNETLEKLRELHYIEMVLKGAKADVEYCLHPKQGWENYSYALRLLDKLRCCKNSCR